MHSQTILIIVEFIIIHCRINSIWEKYKGNPALWIHPGTCSCESGVTKSARRGKTRYIYTFSTCLLYTSDAADERSSVDLGGRRIIKKKKKKKKEGRHVITHRHQERKRVH